MHLIIKKGFKEVDDRVKEIMLEVTLFDDTKVSL